MQPVGAGARPSPRLLAVVLGGIALLAWVALWRLEGLTPGGQGHHGVAAPTGLLFGTVFLAGWLLMSTAMMLPTAVPLVALFSRMVGRRSDHSLLVAALVAGYLGAWLAFGGIVLALPAAADLLGVTASPNRWWPAGLFLLAGAFQFSALKYACLDQCRTPFGFLHSHWPGDGRAGARAAVGLGWRHGWFCVGCCWALMLLMFAVGVTHLGWMLVLALLMALEKNAPWGRRLSRPLGAALLAGGIGLGVRALAG